MSLLHRAIDWCFAPFACAWQAAQIFFRSFR